MQQNKYRARPVGRFIIIFLILSMIIFVLGNRMAWPGVDLFVLLAGNIVLFGATLLSFFLYKKALANNNAQAFLRYIYGGMFLKMIICIAAALVYIFIARNTVNKYALLGCFGLYIIYTFIEVKILMQMSKQQKNA